MNITTTEMPLGFVYDLDDTLSDGFPPGFEHGLHSHSRLAAIHEVGEDLGIQALKDVTYELSKATSANTTEHSIGGRLWALLRHLELVEGDTIQHDHPIVSGVVEAKARIHIKLASEHTREIAGAARFIRAAGNLLLPQSIASGSRRAEIQVFTDMFDLNDLIPASRIVGRQDYTHPKPHPEPFEKGFLALGIDDTPENRRRVIGFEDDPMGFASLRAAGLTVAALTTRFTESRFKNLPADLQPDMIGPDMNYYADRFGF